MQFDFERLQLRAHSIATRFPHEQKLAAPRSTADMSEAEKCKCLGFPQTADVAVVGCMSPKFD